LDYFKQLRAKFSKTIPIIEGVPQINKYTNTLKAKLVTKERLTQYLLEITKNIITNINGLKLYDKGF